MKGKKPGKRISAENDIGRFFTKKSSVGTLARRRLDFPPSSPARRQPSKISNNNNDESKVDRSSFLKWSAAAGAGSIESNENAKTARGRLNSEQSSVQLPKRKKRKSTIQLSIGQAFALSPTPLALEPHEPEPLTRSQYPLAGDFPDPSILGNNRVTLTVIPSILGPRHLPLNDEQRRVAEHPPNIPLSVRAGAGSGKTHCMVQRAVNLVKQYGIDPKKILMITFSKKATDELKERIASVFAAEVRFMNEHLRLPTIKTFHSLAYSWICTCWKACGLGAQPSNPLSATAQQRALMKRAIETNLENLRLERCVRMLWGGSGRPDNASWEAVVQTFRSRCGADYDKAFATADRKAKEGMPSEKNNRSKTAEDIQDLNKQMKANRKLLLRVEVYLRLLRRRKGIDVTCDLERRWSGTAQQCGIYLEMVRNARLGHHDKSDYPTEDATIWELYDDLQRETGNIDFDSMLIIFTECVLGNEALARRFHAMYTHTIVDEYQDNSEAQAMMLNKIVEHGSLTVVGDDDQCIYQFRGASPGNFDRLREFFSEQKQIAVVEASLTANYRSSGNILSVAATFLQGVTSRHPKVLRPTKPPGLPVEAWKCIREADQARHIVSAMIERHEREGIPYRDMACLFRCMKMGRLGNITTHIQKEMASRNVPFCLVGGKTIFERETVLDLLGYVRLAISNDDESFERIINKPPRRLPKDKLIPLIKKVKRSSASSISLLEAAKIMCNTGYDLSSSQHTALKAFVAGLDQFKLEVHTRPLPELLKYLWHQSGLNDYHRNKGQGKDDKNGTSRNENQVTGRPAPAPRPCYPSEVKLLLDLATRHIKEWKHREAEVIRQSRSRCKVPSLVELSRSVLVDNWSAVKLDLVPAHILDEIILAPYALGKSTIRDFLACTALQSSTEEPGLSHDSIGKVSISTIHRSKGLEWDDVYVPYFNKGFMPTEHQIDDEDDGESNSDADDASSEKNGADKKRDARIGVRHFSNCDAMQGGRCNKSCSRKFREIDGWRLGGTAEDRHLNEERRLAHVAATRAKNKLVFTMFEHRPFRPFYNGDEEDNASGESPFLEELGQLPDTAFKVVNKEKFRV